MKKKKPVLMVGSNGYKFIDGCRVDDETFWKAKISQEVDEIMEKVNLIIDSIR